MCCISEFAVSIVCALVGKNSFSPLLDGELKST